MNNLKGELSVMDNLGIKPNYAALGRKYGMDWRTVKKYHNGYEGRKATRNKKSKLDEYKTEIADKLTRNEIATSNEMRQVIGWKPSDDPKADELRNSNISQAKQDGGVSVSTDSRSNETENAKQSSTNAGMVELFAMPISTLMSKDKN